jgi:hypothetical protein
MNNLITEKILKLLINKYKFYNVNDAEKIKVTLIYIYKNIINNLINAKKN